MAFDAFLWFVGGGKFIPVGETTDKSFSGVKAFEIKSFKFGAKNNATIGSSSMGAGAGKAEFEKFEITKFTDNGSPQLFGACASGAHFDAAYLGIRKAGGTQSVQKPVTDETTAATQAYLVYAFKFVFVDSINWSGSTGDDVPEETVTFAYGALKILYSKQKKDGSLISPPAEQMWSQVLNQPQWDVV